MTAMADDALHPSAPARSWRLRIKSLLPKSLLGRSLLIILTPLILLQLVTATVFYDRHWGTITRRLAGSVAGDVGVIVAYLRDHPGPASRAWIVAEARQHMQLEMRLADGEVLRNLPVGDSDISLAPLAHELENVITLPFQLHDGDDDDTIEIRIQTADGVLTVESPKKRLSSFTVYLFLLWMVGTSLLLFGIATIFMSNQVRAVRRLAIAADSFGKGRDAPWFKPEGATEVRQAAQAFLQMRERIKRQIDQRTEMLAGVSHDLRTPLTRMKLQLAMMPGDPAAADLTEDVAEMERMVEGYLAFARGEGREQMRPSNIADLVESVVGRFTRNAAPIDLHVERRLTMPLRPHAMERCLSNLIGNAVRYAEHIAVRVGQRGDAVEILIDDDGPGIPPEKRADVFRAFFRIESSRNRETGGVGLGLTIARDVARSHGGDIQLAESPLGGLRVRLILPL
ncbi:Periplasmic Sensor Signal Transduction Histidine Kinase [uncultured Alphaproteobacteria bacterium]|uniref:histidine kinase n=1 Tax=uncultured Alphaproteobacteria bacterium TaxID=91750 RepID=A0A212JW71_9PROT|nr:Periplasmic Sensor Signal Transduction Histidine Kinase [uncultured Alphaproteobacteria bacterium]